MNINQAIEKLEYLKSKSNSPGEEEIFFCNGDGWLQVIKDIHIDEGVAIIDASYYG